MSQSTPLLANHYYHIYNRGNNGGNLFFEDRNYRYFFELYRKHIFPFAKTYAYCLMKNHFHLLVSMRSVTDLSGFQNLKGLSSSKEINYSQQFSNLFNAYTKAINKAYQRTGSLFEKPFHRILVDSDKYFIQLVSYIHRNPQEHGFVSDFRDYPYSSYCIIRDQKRSRIETKTTINWFGSISSFEAYHFQFDKMAVQHLIIDD